MKTLQRVPIAVALLFFQWLVIPALPASAATVTFRVAAVEGQAGGTVDVPITAAAAPNLGAVHFELLYDPKVVTPDTVSRGALAGNNALIDFNADNAGRLLIGLVTLEGLKGDGAMASVRFKVVGNAGTSSALTLDNNKAWESGTHAEVLVKAEAGKVTVGGGSSLFLILAALAACLAMLFLFGVFLWFMRRRPKAQPAPVQPGYYAPVQPPPPGYYAAAQPPPPAYAPRAPTSPPRPMGLPERENATPPAPASDTYKKAENEYFALKGRLAAGRITQEQFEAALKDLVVQDAQGRYWMLGADTGKWFVHNGQAWVEGQPY